MFEELKADLLKILDPLVYKVRRPLFNYYDLSWVQTQTLPAMSPFLGRPFELETTEFYSNPFSIRENDGESSGP